LGVAIVTMDSDQFRRVNVAADASGIQTVVPEQVRFTAALPYYFPGAPVQPQFPGAAPGGTGFPPQYPYYPPYPPYFAPGMGYPYGMMPPPGYPYGPPMTFAFPAPDQPGGFPGQGAAPPFPFPPGFPVAPPGVPQFVPQPPAVAVFSDGQATWGLQATNVLGSNFTGQGVRVAVLDTGLDFNHPDFVGRVKDKKDFISGAATPQDFFGHGTHCAGTACGPLKPKSGPRYGVATDAELFVGKVLDNHGGLPAGVGVDGTIIAGIEWALEQGCHVVSMSFTAPPPDPAAQLYEQVGSVCLLSGTILIAAAGNASKRPFDIQPCGSPANIRTFTAVGAVDANMAIANFSNRSGAALGQSIDLVAPGVDVLSAASSTASLPHMVPTIDGLYRKMPGTSMATPHVAGIAALYVEEHWDKNKDPGDNAAFILDLLLSRAKPLHQLDPRDAGHGLVQA
jgi:subtilisin family serine protease